MAALKNMEYKLQNAIENHFIKIIYFNKIFYSKYILIGIRVVCLIGDVYM